LCPHVHLSAGSHTADTNTAADKGRLGNYLATIGDFEPATTGENNWQVELTIDKPPGYAVAHIRKAAGQLGDWPRKVADAGSHTTSRRMKSAARDGR